MESYLKEFESLMPLVIEYGMDILGAVIVLILGWAAAGWFSSKARRAAERSGKIDDTLTPLISKVVRFLVLIITVLAVLNQFGVQTASVIAILSAAGLAIGLALQGTLTNIASGIVILILRPFQVGDVVDIGGTKGVVDEVGLFTTNMHTFNNVAITMPNSKVWGNTITNFTTNDTRRIDLVIGIGYDDSMDKAIDLLEEIVKADERVLPEPEPMIKVSNLGASSVDIVVRPWVKSTDYIQTQFDLTKRIKERFDEEGVSFPFPQRDVHLFQEK